MSQVAADSCCGGATSRRNFVHHILDRADFAQRSRFLVLAPSLLFSLVGQIPPIEELKFFEEEKLPEPWYVETSVV